MKGNQMVTYKTKNNEFERHFCDAWATAREEKKYTYNSENCIKFYKHTNLYLFNAKYTLSL